MKLSPLEGQNSDPRLLAPSLYAALKELIAAQAARINKAGDKRRLRALFQAGGALKTYEKLLADQPQERQ